MTTTVEDTSPDTQQNLHERGELGTATAGDKMKQLHRSEKGRKVSLRAFVRKLASEGDDTAKQYLANKKGLSDPKRTDANKSLAAIICAATKSKRRTKKGAK